MFAGRRNDNLHSKLCFIFIKDKLVVFKSMDLLYFTNGGGRETKCTMFLGNKNPSAGDSSLFVHKMS